MDSTLHKKIVLGTVYKQHKKAKIYGEICLTDIDLLDIILSLSNYCHLNLDFDTKQCLDKMARDLQNKNKNICSYRNKNLNDKKFID